MADVLIRDVPEDVIAGLDERARSVGVSRSEYLRRVLAREAFRAEAAVTVDDLSTFAETFADLADDSVMDQAWH